MVNYACAFSQSELEKYFEWIIITSSITWQTWRKHDAKRGRGGKERLLQQQQQQQQHFIHISITGFVKLIE